MDANRDADGPEHNLLGSPIAETVIEPRVGEVEVRLYAESPARTGVELEHRHIDRHGPGWEAVAGGVDGPEGWPLYLDRYAALAQQGR